MSVKADRRRIRVVRWTAPALAVLLAMSSQAWAATTDTFSSTELSGYAAGGASGWYVTNEQLAHTYTSNTSFVELVRPTETPRAEADLTLSTGRANAGLTVLWKDHSNHLWAKLEISPGNPNGIMTIGRRLRGKVTSLLASSRGGLTRGATYHVVLQVSGGVATFTATGRHRLVLQDDLVPAQLERPQRLRIGRLRGRPRQVPVRRGRRWESLGQPDGGLSRRAPGHDPSPVSASTRSSDRSNASGSSARTVTWPSFRPGRGDFP